MTTRRKPVMDGRIRWHSNVIDDLIDCEQIRPHPQNPNNGDEDEVRESILTNGVYRHIYADRKTKQIVAGHTQYAVEIELQLEDGIDRPRVPVSWVDGDNPQHVLKMLSVDNAAARKAKLDKALQLDLLRDLDDLTGSGYDDDEMSELMAELDALDSTIEGGMTDADHVPEPPATPISTYGDVWELGPHRLVVGDATDPTVFEVLMHGDDDTQCIAVASPPYNAGKSVTGEKYVETRDDDLNDDDWRALNVDSQALVLEHAALSVVNVQMIAGNKRALIDVLSVWRDRIADIAVWNKATAQPAMARNVMNSKYEWLIFLADHELPTRAIKTASFRGTVHNVFESSAAHNQEFADVHRATFPVALPAWVIEHFSRRGARVIDCFGGTGTTIIACHQLGRVGRLIELDPTYADVICRRYQEHTGTLPQRDGVPVDFAE